MKNSRHDSLIDICIMSMHNVDLKYVKIEEIFIILFCVYISFRKPDGFSALSINS